ncbi:WD40/YVTN/BNR-like repeat-containing protein [Natronorarus salvus]|uniref:WD40/YVTN/BNR-like repeat-containing protein n=1 Tax=Natronorarus salvus TaxID=3117733 RepID=UPI002F262731
MPRIYAALRDGLVVATGEGDEWRTATELTDRRIECVAVSPERPNRILVGTFDAGLYRSEDGGDSFERVGEAVIDSERVTSATVSPHDPDELWVGTEPSAVYRSSDGGDTWEQREGITDLPSEPEWYFPPRPDTHHVRWIEVDPRERERLYVGIEAGALLVTDDAGESWSERPPGSRRDNHSLATHPELPDRVWSAAGDGYAESHDGGETWDRPQEGLDHRYCWSVVPVPDDPETTLLSSASGANAAHRVGESYLYRRRDGEPWERLDDRGIPTGEGTYRAVLATAGAGVYAATNHGIHQSEDGGDSWDRLPLDSREAFEDRAVRGLAVVEG